MFISNDSIKLLCLNDNDEEICKEVYDSIIELFDEKFPDKSTFEK